MIDKTKSKTSIISFVLRICLLQIIITPFLATADSACPDGQYLLYYYLQSDIVTKLNQLSTCISILQYGYDYGCLGYYLDSATNLINCIQCDSSHTFPIQLDSGRNFCGVSVYSIYNLDCSLYIDKNPQFLSSIIPLTLYKCKTCKDPKKNLITVQNYFGIKQIILFNQHINLINTVCTDLPLISGKNGGEECLVYEGNIYQYKFSGSLTNNMYSMVCGQCKTTAVSMDCSFSCGANQYQIKYFQSSSSIISTCISGGGTQSWDNSYLPGYTYNCEVYASYDSVNKVLGKCVNLIITNCLEYDLNILPKCIRCSQNYYLIYQTNQCIPSVIYCASYLGTMCTQCIQSYSLVNQTCVMPSPSNCDVYNSSNGNCSKCKNEYFLNSLMKCDSYKVCLNYQYLNTSINECTEGQIQNCLIYLNNGIQCSKCEPNYQIDSLGFFCKYVTPAVICSNNTNKVRYEIISGKCVQVDINCKYYLENGYCYQCLDQYYQFNGSCYPSSQILNSTFLTTKISNS